MEGLLRTLEGAWLFVDRAEEGAEVMTVFSTVDESSASVLTAVTMGFCG